MHGFQLCSVKDHQRANFCGLIYWLKGNYNNSFDSIKACLPLRQELVEVKGCQRKPAALGHESCIVLEESEPFLTHAT